MTISADCDNHERKWYAFQAKLDAWVGRFQPPLAVFVPHDFFCRHVAHACLRAGLSIPEDVALIGMGDDMLLCAQGEPSLSSVDVCPEQVGHQAAALLDRLMKGESPPPAPVLIAPLTVVPRRSTDICMVDDLLVSRAFQFIGKHLHEGVRVDDIATHLATTRRTLDRRFCQALGRSTRDEIARLRLERARRLLLETDDPVKVVAGRCGFQNLSHFGHAFLVAVGVSPGAYRKCRNKGNA